VTSAHRANAPACGIEEPVSIISKSRTYHQDGNVEVGPLLLPPRSRYDTKHLNRAGIISNRLNNRENSSIAGSGRVKAFTDVFAETHTVYAAIYVRNASCVRASTEQSTVFKDPCKARGRNHGLLQGTYRRLQRGDLGLERSDRGLRRAN